MLLLLLAVLVGMEDVVCIVVEVVVTEDFRWSC